MKACRCGLALTSFRVIDGTTFAECPRRAAGDLGHDASVYMDPGGAAPKCDFDSKMPVVAYFESIDTLIIPTAAAPAEVPIFGSTGAWAACEDCAELVRRGDRDGVLDRSLDGFDSGDVPREIVREHFAILHDAFWNGHAAWIREQEEAGRSRDPS